MYSLLGPTVGSALTIARAEYLRVEFGLRLIGMAETIYDRKCPGTDRPLGCRRRVACAFGRLSSHGA